MAEQGEGMEGRKPPLTHLPLPFSPSLLPSFLPPTHFPSFLPLERGWEKGRQGGGERGREEQRSEISSQLLTVNLPLSPKAMTCSLSPDRASLLNVSML